MTSLGSQITNARATHAVSPFDVDNIISHRKIKNSEQYLVRWKNGNRQDAMYSWHSVLELKRSLNHVQRYIERVSVTNIQQLDLDALPKFPNSRKRKSPETDPSSRDLSLTGLLTPAGQSRSSSVSTPAAANDIDSHELEEPLVYNGYFERKEGRLIAKTSDRQGVAVIDGRKLPTREMMRIAARTPLQDAKCAIREAFIEKLRPLRNVQIRNDLDLTTPSLDFEFITSYRFREGTAPADPETLVGCQQCSPDMGQRIGCESPQKCDCLELAAVDEQKLQVKDPVRYKQYQVDRDPAGLPKRFPYTKHSLQNPSQPSVLVPWYREQRYPIYECNHRCKCGPRCKSRLVQKGRRVPLTIFKTAERGWGVSCDEDLIQGEFIDTYLGEVITNDEAERREEKFGKDKNSYLYSLDKFVGDMGLQHEDCFVVDGQYIGGPTRFINHSCEPNCRQYTVSYNKNDLRVYDIAFFAYDDIRAGTELTFDYMDKDEEEEEDAIRARLEAINDPENVDKVKCNCGATKCRGFLWV